ncbi:MAG: DUF4870 domain-containing protein [Cyanobacteria bacterium P01_A01_bin.84]
MRNKFLKQMRFWGMLCHLSAIAAWMLVIYLLFIGVPLYLPLNILAPLIIWRYKKAQYPWIDFQGKESLNFQISLTLYTLVFIIISLLILLVTFGVSIISNNIFTQVQPIFNGLLIGSLILILGELSFQLFVVNFAAIKAYKGEHYRYPFTIRLLR